MSNVIQVEFEQQTRLIRLPVHGIVIMLSHECGSITSDLLHDVPHHLLEYAELCAAVNALESLILAHAVAGIDVETPAYMEGIETAINAAFQRFDF